ncbi:hypothetical protein F4859DRAFT_522079 [Xylaria cf. heliscus]|nr:hypothetical protein F4859DRAFT_522079 [Xylaria cf. heliscus]
MNDGSDKNALYSRNDPKDITRTQALLTQYFDRDEEQRFYMESIVGGGMFGLTWKLRYMTPPTNSNSEPSFQHIILKTDRIYSLYDDVSKNNDEGGENGGGDDDNNDNNNNDDDDTGKSLIPNEKKWLEVSDPLNTFYGHKEILRWSKHIVNDLTPTKDPLSRQFPGVRPHHMGVDNWVYLEWLENGTLERLVNRAIKLGIRLPNRVLWRFFLCLIRMCIALGWPAEKPEGEDPQPVTEVAKGRARGGLIHRDMHNENIMFGKFIPNDPDLEHTMTPIVKLIDLGSMQMVAGDKLVTPDVMRGAVKENLFDIGIIMVELVTLNSDLARGIYPSESLAKNFSINPGGQELMTNGDILLPNGNINPYPNLDTALRGLICSCLATKPENRPVAPSLANVVTTCIRNRDGQFYASRGYAGESDDDIRAIMSQLIFDAV